MAFVLVIDDVEDSRHLLATMVRACGHTATDAADGVEALARIRSTPIDMVLLDLRMPGMDGLEVLAELNREPPAHRPRIIVMTTSPATDAELAATLQLGAEGFLSKCDLDFEWLGMLLNSQVLAIDLLESAAVAP